MEFSAEFPDITITITNIYNINNNIMVKIPENAAVIITRRSIFFIKKTCICEINLLTNSQMRVIIIM